MKHLDWQLIMFVGGTLIQEYWIHWGLPKVYYWEVRKKELTNEDDDKKVA